MENIKLDDIYLLIQSVGGLISGLLLALIVSTTWKG